MFIKTMIRFVLMRMGIEWQNKAFIVSDDNGLM